MLCQSVFFIAHRKLKKTALVQPVELQHLDENVEQVTARSFTEGIDVNTTVTILRGKGVY
jgi:hypothetical protein